jgi:hypothetical protein
VVLNRTPVESWPARHTWSPQLFASLGDPEHALGCLFLPAAGAGDRVETDLHSSFSAVRRPPAVRHVTAPAASIVA